VYRTREQAEAEQKAAIAAAADAAAGPALTPPVRTSLEGLYAKPPGGALTVLPIAFRDGATRLMAQIALRRRPCPLQKRRSWPSSSRPRTGRTPRVSRRRQASRSRREISTRAGPSRSRRRLRCRGRPSGRVRRCPRIGTAARDGDGPVRGVLVLPAPSRLERPRGGLKKPDDPFVFSGRRFIAKPEARFDAKDGLIYAIRVYNPAVDAAKKSMFLKRSLKIKPKNGPAIDVPGSAEQPTPVPEIKDKGTLVIDLAGSIVDENLGEYFRPASMSCA